MNHGGVAIKDALMRRQVSADGQALLRRMSPAPPLLHQFLHVSEIESLHVSRMFGCDSYHTNTLLKGVQSEVAYLNWYLVKTKDKEFTVHPS